MEEVNCTRKILEMLYKMRFICSIYHKQLYLKTSPSMYGLVEKKEFSP